MLAKNDLHQVSLIAGRYRIPERARPGLKVLGGIASGRIEEDEGVTALRARHRR